MEIGLSDPGLASVEVAGARVPLPLSQPVRLLA